MTPERNEHFKSLQGTLDISRLVDGKRTTMRELGNQTSVELGVETESITIKETKTGKRQDAKKFVKSKSVSLSVTCNELKPEDVALAFGAELIKKGEKTVTDEVLPTVVEGDRINLDGINITDLEITDDSGTALDDTHYDVDLTYGGVKFKDVSTLSQPFKASYKEGAAESAVLFSLPDNAEYYVMFKGVDSYSDEPMAFELWKFSPDVNNTMQFIHEETGEITISGTALADSTRNNDPELGGFGRIINVAS